VNQDNPPQVCYTSPVANIWIIRGVPGSKPPKSQDNGS
jgi:hypothetical protein